MMELEDCAFPLLAGMSGTRRSQDRVQGCRSRAAGRSAAARPGMERKDLLLENAKIFIEQGKALDAVASRGVKVLVVGNPANTNAYIAMKSRPVAAEEELHGHAAPRSQPRALAARGQGRRAGRLDRETDRLGQSFADDVSRLSLRHLRRCNRSRAAINDENWNRTRIHPHGRQARCGDHRSARSVIGRLGGQCGDRPRARLARRQRRQMGHDGRALGRQLRHSQRRDVRRPGHHRGRRVSSGSGTSRSTPFRANGWTRP